MTQIVREREHIVSLEFVQEQEHNPQGELTNTNIKLLFDDTNYRLPDFVKAAIRYRFEELLLSAGSEDLEVTEQFRSLGEYTTDFNFQCDDDYGLVFWTQGAGMWLVLQEDGVVYTEQAILSSPKLREEALGCRDLAWLLNWDIQLQTVVVRRILI